MLSSQNKHDRDSRVKFVESSHTYFIDGSSDGYISSTTLVHSLFEKFDADKIIMKMRNSPRWKFSPYHGMTDDAIKKKWDSTRDYAASQGTKMHENIENYYNKQEYDNKTTEFGLFQQYIKDHENLVPFRSEWVIFDEISKVSGSVDMLYRDPSDPSKLIIADWKRSKEIKMDNKWQKGLNEYVSHLDDCNFIHYSLQLSIYKYIIEKRYGIEVSQCFLVILHPKQDTYHKHVIMDLSKEVKNIMDSRSDKPRKPDNTKESSKRKYSKDSKDECSFKSSFLKFN